MIRSLVLLLVAFYSLVASASESNIEQISPSAQYNTIKANSNNSYKYAIRKQLYKCFYAVQMDYPLPKIPVSFVKDFVRDSHGNLVTVAPHFVSPQTMPPVGILLKINNKGKIIYATASSESKKNALQYPAYRGVLNQAFMAVKACNSLSNIPNFPKFDNKNLLTFPMEFNP